MALSRGKKLVLLASGNNSRDNLSNYFLSEEVETTRKFPTDDKLDTPPTKSSYESTTGVTDLERNTAVQEYNRQLDTDSCGPECSPSDEYSRLLGTDSCDPEYSPSGEYNRQFGADFCVPGYSRSDVYNRQLDTDSSDPEYSPSDESETESQCSSDELSYDDDNVVGITNSTKPHKINIARVPSSTPTGTHTKTFFCIYCKKSVKRFARHLLGAHKKEKKVIEIMRFPVKHKQRQILITEIRNEGTFFNNTSNSSNNGSLIVTRRPNVSKPRKVDDYSPCPSCYGYFVKNNLNRHIKNCSLNQGEHVSRGIKAQSQALKIEMDLQNYNFDSLVPELLSNLRDDPVSDVVKNDIVLLHLASHMCKKYRTEKHLNYYTRQKLRQLARLLITIKEDNPEIVDFKECLQPAYFYTIIHAVQKMCQLNEDTGEFKTPSLANHLGIYLKECLNILYSLSIFEQDDNQKKKVVDFKELMCLEYGASISRAARKTLEESKWNKPKLLPLISDIQLFRDHLINRAEKAKQKLDTEGFSNIEWRTLVEMSAALVLLFNRKRPGETERLLLSSYYEKQSIDQNSESYDTLTTLEKLLSKTFQRIELRGKHGRRVPILLRNNHVRYIETFLKFRKEAGLLSNIYLFGNDSKYGFVRLTNILRNESALCGAKEPLYLRATYLRKQVATTSQILDLNDNEMQMIADFMGHDIQIHKSHYRTPELTLQIARLSKLLLAVDEGDLSKYKDKSLKNIDVTEYLNITEDTEVMIPENNTVNNDKTALELENNEQDVNTDSEEWTDTFEETNPKSNLGHGRNRSVVEHKLSPKFKTTPSKQKIKIKRVTWRTPEKKIVRSLFKTFLETCTLPSEKEAAEAIRKYAELGHRTPIQVKSWINNQNRKLKL